MKLIPFLFLLWVWECDYNEFIIDAQALDPSCLEGKITWSVTPSVPYLEVNDMTIIINHPPAGTYHVQISSPNPGCAGFTTIFTMGD